MKLTSWPSGALCALAMAFAAAPALAGDALDGKRFDGVFMERGKTSGDADTLTFRDGRFRSSACDKYGYSDAAYKTSTLGDMTAFEAETESARYGKLQWKGTVRGDKLDATVISVRSGKQPVENWVVAAEKK
ncbi:MAG: hypothetical protein ACXW14_06815 [Burkholderiaceae bacterium]